MLLAVELESNVTILSLHSKYGHFFSFLWYSFKISAFISEISLLLITLYSKGSDAALYIYFYSAE